MASKTGKLMLSGAVTAALAAGCQTQPLSTSPSLALDRAGQDGYSVLGKGGKGKHAQGGGSESSTAATAGDCLEQPYAVFARSESELFHLTGARNVIEGDVHTNDMLKMAGNNDVITGAGEAVDGYFIKGKSNTIGSQPATTVESYPLTISPDSLTGDVVLDVQGDVNLNDRPEVWAAKGVLKSGIYRATGAIILPKNGVTGTVTFVAQRIQLPGKNHTLTAYSGGVLGFATGGGSNTIHLSGNSNTYAGLFAAPNGAFQMTGHQNEVSGMIMADTFKMSGSNNTIKFADHGYCTPAGPEEPTPTPSAEATPEPTPEPTASPIPTPTPTGEPTPEPDPVESPAPSPSLEPTPSPTTTPLPASPEPSPTTAPTMAPTPTPEPTLKPRPL